eukprot:scaffold301_cov370-Pavlova_lutheri.AAC.19
MGQQEDGSERSEGERNASHGRDQGKERGAETHFQGKVLRERGNGTDAWDAETSTAADEFFLYHKLASKDTLAGLAVKYNVQLTDIKRANLIDTENGLYALHVVRIPRKPMQVGALQRLAYARRENRNKKQGHAKGNVDLSAAAEAALMKLQRHYSTSSLASYDDPSGGKQVGFLGRAARQARRSVGALLDQTWNHHQVTLIGGKGTEAGYVLPGEDNTRLRRRTEGAGGADPGTNLLGIEMTETNTCMHEANTTESSVEPPNPTDATASTALERKSKNPRFPNLTTLKQKSSMSAARLSKTLPFKSNSKLD